MQYKVYIFMSLRFFLEVNDVCRSVHIKAVDSWFLRITLE